MNGATCSHIGVRLKGLQQYVSFDSWGWGGEATSAEAYFNIDAVKAAQFVFSFTSDGGAADAFRLGEVNDWVFDFTDGSDNRYEFSSNDFLVSNTWMHVIVVCDGTNQILYKNGGLPDTKPAAAFPKYATRGYQYFGRGISNPWNSNDVTAQGYVLTMRMWNGRALSSSEALTLYGNRNKCKVGYFGSLGCTMCTPGTFSDSPGAESSCKFCPGGKFQPLQGATSCVGCPQGRFSSAGSTECPGSVREWDFRGCVTGNPIKDTYSSLNVLPINSPTCDPTGWILNGFSQYGKIHRWSWGGSFSVEVYLYMSTCSEPNSIFMFGYENPASTISLGQQDCGNGPDSFAFGVEDYSGSGNTLNVAGPGSYVQWYHLVVAVDGTSQYAYVNVRYGPSNDAMPISNCNCLCIFRRVL